MENAISIANFLIGLGHDIKLGKPIESALDELEEALEEWKEQFLEENNA